MVVVVYNAGGFADEGDAVYGRERALRYYHLF